jgi:hypothetical protein
MSAIPLPIQVLLDLFNGCLAEVRFADLDGQTLARCAAEVDSAAISMATAQLNLDAARQALHDKQEALLQRAQRALAYARVYAEADEGLARQLDAVSLPRPARRPRPEDALVLSAEPQPAARPKRRRKEPVAVAAPSEPAPMLEGLSSTAE